MEFAQQLLNAFSLGAIYALIALGFTMVYGVLRFINFANSDVFMIGAVVGSLLGNHLPMGTWWGGLACLLAAMAVCALVGVVIERVAYRPLRAAPRLNFMITSIGVSLLIEYLFQNEHVFGAAPRPFPPVFPSVLWQWHGLSISSNQLIVIGVSLVLVVALELIVYRTRIGTAMRAISLNPRAAQLVGINPDVVVAFTFALGSALAGAGGVLYALNYQSVEPLMGVMPGLKAFVAAVLGGIGSIPGAALGGLLIGGIETFIGGSQFSTYKDAIAFALLILILLFRPTGLLGRRIPEKV